MTVRQMAEGVVKADGTRLSHGTGLKSRSVFLALKTLESKGLVKRFSRPGRATKYRFLCPEPAQSDAHLPLHQNAEVPAQPDAQGCAPACTGPVHGSAHIKRNTSKEIFQQKQQHSVAADADSPSESNHKPTTPEVNHQSWREIRKHYPALARSVFCRIMGEHVFPYGFDDREFALGMKTYGAPVPLGGENPGPMQYAFAVLEHMRQSREEDRQEAERLKTWIPKVGLLKKRHCKGKGHHSSVFWEYEPGERVCGKCALPIAKEIRLRVEETLAAEAQGKTAADVLRERRSAA